MNLSQVEFTSSARYEYIAIKSSTAFTTSGGTPNSVTVTITHNLGYIPFFRIFIKFPDHTKYYDMFNGPALLLGNWQIESITASTSTIVLVITNFISSSALTGTVYYRIYAEPQDV